MPLSDELSAALEQARLRGAIASSIPPIHRLTYPRLTQTEVKEQGSGFSLRSWSAGSVSKRLLRRLQRRGG